MRKLCSIDGCSRPNKAKEMCATHYMRVRNGSPINAPTRGPAGRIIDGAVSYSTVHYRLRREFGPASSHGCNECPRPAAEWAYIGGAPDETAGPNGRSGRYRTYSAIRSYYKPMCRSCHRKMDGVAPQRVKGVAL